jgi:hypothetical protein
VAGKKLIATISQEAYRRLGFVAMDLECPEAKVLDALILAHLPPCSMNHPGLVSSWELPVPVFAEGSEEPAMVSAPHRGVRQAHPPKKGVVVTPSGDDGKILVDFDSTRVKELMTAHGIKRAELAKVAGVGLRRFGELLEEGRMAKERWELVRAHLREKVGSEYF